MPLEITTGRSVAGTEPVMTGSSSEVDGLASNEVVPVWD